MDTYRTIHGIRVVEWHEIEKVLFELERSAAGTGGIDACLSEPFALEALEQLAEVKQTPVNDGILPARVDASAR